jgi:hypothetical protein
MISTRDAIDKCGHGFICGTCLDLGKGTFFGPTFTAGKGICGSFNGGFVLVFVAFYFFQNHQIASY